MSKPEPGGGRIVMVVDDEPALVELAEELLAGLGYEAVGYTSCKGALSAFETNPDSFDLVLSDVMLPGMNGHELAERLHAIRPQMPILLASGNVSDEMEQRARAANVVAVLKQAVGVARPGASAGRRLRDRSASLMRKLQPQAFTWQVDELGMQRQETPVPR
jgi:CheY-like chemotaxis protein